MPTSKVLRVFENKVMRRLFGPKIVEDYKMGSLMIYNPHQTLFE